MIWTTFNSVHERDVSECDENPSIPIKHLKILSSKINYRFTKTQQVTQNC